MSQELRELLYEKATAEQDKFIENLKLQTPEKIISASYEKVMREDILMSFEPDNTYLSDRQVKELLRLDYPLSACYNEWMQTECSHMEMLQETISDFADDLIKEQNEKANRKKYEPER